MIDLTNDSPKPVQKRATKAIPKNLHTSTKPLHSEKLPTPSVPTPIPSPPRPEPPRITERLHAEILVPSLPPTAAPPRVAQRLRPEYTLPSLPPTPTPPQPPGIAERLRPVKLPAPLPPTPIPPPPRPEVPRVSPSANRAYRDQVPSSRTKDDMPPPPKRQATPPRFFSSPFNDKNNTGRRHAYNSTFVDKTDEYDDHSYRTSRKNSADPTSRIVDVSFSEIYMIASNQFPLDHRRDNRGRDTFPSDFYTPHITLRSSFKTPQNGLTT